MDHPIRTERLTKHYGDVVGIDDVWLEVPALPDAVLAAIGAAGADLFSPAGVGAGVAVQTFERRDIGA